MPTFFSPKKVSLGITRKMVVIFDSPLEGLIRDAIETKFKPSDLVQFDPRYRMVAIVPLVLALIRLGSLGREPLTIRYLVWFLRIVRPQILISGAFNNEFLYRGKILAKLPELRLVVFQNGHSARQALPHLDGLNEKDTIFCISESYEQIFRDRLGGISVVASGSLSSLKFKGEMNKKPCQLKKVGYISTRSGPPEECVDGVSMVRDFSGQLVPEDFFFEHELNFLTRVQPILESIGCRLQIFGSSIEYSAEEERFYREHITDGDWTFTVRSSILSNYSSVQDVDLVLCSDSTLGFEALSMGQSVAFFEVPNHILGSRIPTLYPSHEQPPGLLQRLVMRSEESDDVWLKRIRDLTQMGSKERQELASQVLGTRVLGYSRGDLLNALFSE